MAINKERIKKQIQRAIENLPTEIVLMRDVKTEVGRDSYSKTPTEIKVFNGFLDTGSSRLSQLTSNNGDFGKVNPVKNITLLAIYDDTFNIEKGDYFTINGIKHNIVYPKNNYGIYWECDVAVILDVN